MGKMSRDKVEWLPAPHLPDYEVSEAGEVRAIVARSNRRAGLLIKGEINRQGYRRYTLRKDGEQRKYWAHRLVCEAWHGPKPSREHIVAHADADPANNHFSNLRWATHAENAQDMIRHGNSLRGESNAAAKLTNEQAKQIRRRFKGRWGESKKLADEYGVSRWAIHRVTSGRSFQNV